MNGIILSLRGLLLVVVVSMTLGATCAWKVAGDREASRGAAREAAFHRALYEDFGVPDAARPLLDQKDQWTLLSAAGSDYRRLAQHDREMFFAASNCQAQLSAYVQATGGRPPFLPGVPAARPANEAGYALLDLLRPGLGEAVKKIQNARP